MKKTLYLVLAVLLTISCGTVPTLFGPTPTPTLTLTPTPTFTPTPSPTVTPTPLPTIVPPDPPEAGYSNVYGRVLWRGQPVAGFDMHLGNDHAEVISKSYYEWTETDSDGRFVFTGVPAGDGFILEPWVYDTEDLAGVASAVAVTLSVPADTNFNFGDYHLVEMDLVILEPERESELNGMPASLSWQAYPGAAYYHVELKQEYGTYTDMAVDTDETRLDLTLPLMDCTYGWDVTAYDAGGVPLARSDTAYVDNWYEFPQMYDGLFTIRNDMLPWCRIRLLSPEYKAHLSGGSFKLEWELHPLAVRYTVSIRKDSGSFFEGTYKAEFGWYSGTVEVREDGSLASPSPALPYFGNGVYYWWVYAYAGDGGQLAASSRGQFSVP